MRALAWRIGGVSEAAFLELPATAAGAGLVASDVASSSDRLGRVQQPRHIADVFGFVRLDAHDDLDAMFIAQLHHF